MILRFLNLFAIFRDAVAARLVAESDARRERSRADKLEERIQELERELIEVHRQFSDRLSQRFLGIRLTSDATMPDHDPQANTTISFGRTHARVVQMDAMKSFFEDTEKYLKANEK